MIGEEFWFETLGFRLKPEDYGGQAIVDEVFRLLDMLASIAAENGVQKVCGQQ